ncbi:hypothetical protein A2U01_0065482, partial [Trifolium medium]|nr:hypothetical protein [Trifolium medium]
PKHERRKIMQENLKSLMLTVFCAMAQLRGAMAQLLTKHSSFIL